MAGQGIWKITGVLYVWTMLKNFLSVIHENIIGRRPRGGRVLEGCEVGEDDLMVFEGTLKGAAEEARKERRPLAVYIHSPEHQESDNFVRNTLANQSVAGILRQNFTFWTASVESQDGYIFSSKAEASAYPLFVVLYVGSNEDMVMVLKVEGAVSAAQLYRRLSEALDTCNSATQTQRADILMREDRARLREQQAQELAAAQQADRVAAERERELQEIEEAEQRGLEELEALKVRLRMAMPSEPPADEPGVITLKISLFSGESIQRRFRKSDKLELVYDIVTCHDSYDGTDFYISSFPSRRLLRTATLEEYDLYPRAAVIARAESSV